MAITDSGVASSLTRDDADGAGQAVLGQSLKIFLPIAILVCGVFISVRYYQQWAAWDYGLDATTAEFGTYWMTLFYVEAASMVAISGISWAYLWFTRDAHLPDISAHEEFRRYFRFIGIIAAYVMAFYWAGSFFAEQDAAWHQTVVRDTSFTPSHIPLFYLSFPVFIWLGGSVAFYSITRLPVYANRLSAPVLIAVIGPFLLLPNVAFNEWGHAFWNAEEIFSLPLHWGFVLFGWSVLALGGVFKQIMHRLVILWPVVFPEDRQPGAASTPAE